MVEQLNSRKNLIPVAIVVAALIIVAGWIYFNQEQKKEIISGNVLLPQEVASKAIKYINEKILQGQATASLTEAVEENGLYKIKFRIEDREIESYATKDGKLFFPSVLKLDEGITEGETKTTGEIPKTDVPDVKLFVMSFCPYGNQAEELMMPVDELLAGKADIKLHYVIYSNYGGGGPNFCLDEENQYCSMHGIQELNQGARELCVQKYQKEKLWDFVKKINEKCTSQNADSCWEGIGREAGIDIAKIKDCQKNEALQLLAEELELNKQYGIQGSPQLLINNTEYQGERSSEGYKSGICSGFNNPPEECSQTLSGQAGSVQGGCK